MRPIEMTEWDNGRLQVNRDFVEILQRHQLLTFDALMRFQGGEVAKHIIAERPTTRLVLPTPSGPVTLFLKRHAPARLKEYLKPLIRFRWPCLGAKPEWNAIRQFQGLGIPTMTPVAVGQRGRESLLITLAIEDCEKLSDWMKSAIRPLDRSQLSRVRGQVRELAAIARRMHDAGLHHQDFYAGHVLLPRNPTRGIHILDLGRVHWCRRLARFWIVKDLAQLHYSTGWFTATDRLRFLTAYLGRPLKADDRVFIRQILRKSARIARHSRKHGL